MWRDVGESCRWIISERLLGLSRLWADRRWFDVDPDIRWLRRQIVLYLMKRLTVELVVAFWLMWAALTWLGWSQTNVVPLAAIGAQVFAFIRLTLGLLNNPLSQQAVTAHIDNPPKLARAPIELSQLGDDTAMLGTWGFHPILTAVQAAPERQPLFDVFQSTDGLATIAIGRVGKTIMVLSRLADGRIVASTDLLIPPSPNLIVNLSTQTQLRDVLWSHHKLLIGLGRRGAHLRPAPPELLTEVLRLEHDAYCQLGPFLTPFFDLDPKFRPLRLSFRLDQFALLERSAKKTRNSLKPGRGETITNTSTAEGEMRISTPVPMHL